VIGKRVTGPAKIAHEPVGDPQSFQKLFWSTSMGPQSTMPNGD
jgi:hypothetical protein